MKINLGHIITVALISFMVFILYLVFSLVNTKVDLAADDYYIQELTYETVIQAKNNSVGFDEKVNVRQENEKVYFSFDKDLNVQNSSGKIYFYKPNNKEADKTFQFTKEQPLNVVSVKTFDKGEYKITITWNFDNVDYLVEKSISLK